jgi:hypothetical protein
VEFTCSLFNIKLTEIFKVKFCTNYEFFHIVPNFREISYLTYRKLPARTHTHTHTHTYTHIQGCIQKFQDSTCKKEFAYLGC